ncbi:MAG: ribonuclease P protein component [Thermoanaerobacteraceae bacterium]|nr:ribonuclease P protein component [Thermoanaerobacteraceae bacterium]
MLPGEYRLKEKRDFKRVYRYGKSHANDVLVIFYLPNKLNRCRIGFSISRKMGKAVVRNRIKRVLREICRRNIGEFKAGYDIIFIARKKIKGIDYCLIEIKLLSLVEQVGLRVRSGE